MKRPFATNIFFGGGRGDEIVMIKIFNKQMGSFLVLKTSAITKWHNKKDWKDTVKYPHHTKQANKLWFPQHQETPKKSRFLLLAVVAVLLVVVVFKTPLHKGYEATSNHLSNRPRVSLTSRESAAKMSCRRLLSLYTYVASWRRCVCGVRRHISVWILSSGTSSGAGV